MCRKICLNCILNDDHDLKIIESRNFDVFENIKHWTMNILHQWNIEKFFKCKIFHHRRNIWFWNERFFHNRTWYNQKWFENEIEKKFNINLQIFCIFVIDWHFHKRIKNHKIQFKINKILIIQIFHIVLMKNVHADKCIWKKNWKNQKQFVNLNW